MPLLRHVSRRLVLATTALGLALAVSAPALGYVIYTKDGSRIEAREKPSVQGKKLLFLTPLGTPQSIALSEWDQARTEKSNRDGLGNAYQLDEPTGDRREIPVPKNSKSSLSEYLRTHPKTAPVDRAPAKPGDDAEKPVERVSEPIPLPLDGQVNETFSRALDGSNLRGARLVAIYGGLRVQATTENEQQVFWALAAIARGLKESRAHGKAIEKVELQLATSNGDNAGRFTMSADDAEALLNGRISPAKFFVANVIF